MVVQQRSSPSVAHYPPFPAHYPLVSDEAPKPVLEQMQQVLHILAFGQLLTEQLNDDFERLCQEVEQVTRQQVQLCLANQRALKKTQLPRNTKLVLPVQFGQVPYGRLYIMADSEQPERPALFPPIAHLLAQVCGWLLYTIEQSTFLHSQFQQIDYNVNGPLTKRESEVLSLMCRGHSQESIASLLCIAPATVGKHRQHIYEQLGVHCERDALLVAYRIGLFTLVK